MKNRTPGFKGSVVPWGLYRGCHGILLANSGKTPELLKLKLNCPQRHRERSKGVWRTCSLMCKPPLHCRCSKEKTKEWRCRATEKMDCSQAGALQPGERPHSPRDTCSCLFTDEATVWASSVPEERQRWEKYRLKEDRNKGDVPGEYLLETSPLGKPS